MAEGEKTERLHQSIARKLGTAILTGEYLPGASFEGEIENSEALGVSRTAYREAMRILVSKGLLASRPRAGTHVTQRSRWNLLDPEILAWMFEQEPDPKFVDDLFELRSVIEPAAAEFAAQRRTDEQLAIMRQSLDVMQQFGLADVAGQTADRQFHRTIFEATHNETIATLAGSVGAAVQWTTQFKQRRHHRPRNPIAEHEALYTAIAKGDAPRARSATLELLQLALKDMSG